MRCQILLKLLQTYTPATVWNHLMELVDYALPKYHQHTMETTRRKFMQDASRFSMGLGMMSLNPTLVKAMKRGVSANEKVGLGLIGARGRGFNVVKH